jgi:hypothetical protein
MLGVLQERVVRSTDDGTLAFYYRVKDLIGPGTVRYMTIRNWPLTGGALDGDYRTDGLGEIGPSQVGCNPADISFLFYLVPSTTEPHITPEALSRFMFIRILPPEAGSPLVVTGHEQTTGLITFGSEHWAVTLPALSPTVH